MKGMGLLIPLSDKLHDLLPHRFFRSDVCEAKVLVLEDTEPVFDLIHPGARRQGTVEAKARMLPASLPHLLAVMGAQGVAHHRDRCDRGRDRLVEILEERAKFCLALSQVTWPSHRASAGVKGGKEMESAVAAILVFDAIGNLVGLCRYGRIREGTRLQEGFLIDR
jgi:hypothetical protein